MNIQFIERFIVNLNRLHLDLIPLIIIQLLKSNENYRLTVNISKRSSSFSEKLCKILKSHVTYGPQIRHHFTLEHIDEHFRKFYRLGCVLHNEYDQPAVLYPDGYKEWYEYGQVHRGDGDQPAVSYSNGRKEWWQLGQRHRDGDQPAIVYADGIQEWWQHGKRHRDGDQPAIVYADGTKCWYQHGLLIK